MYDVANKVERLHIGTSKKIEGIDIETIFQHEYH